MKKINWRITVLTMLTCFTACVVLGQAGVRSVQNGATTELYFSKALNNASTYDKVIGTPYIYEDFVQAKINDLKKTYFVRFNMANNNIEFKGEEGVAMILDKSHDYTISLLDGSNKKFETHSFIDRKGATAKTFFERIRVNEKYGLYLRKTTLFTPVKIAKNSLEQNRPGRFSKAQESFFYKDLSKENATLVVVPKREKLFLKQFGEQSNTLKKFIKNEKLDIAKKADLIRILDYYYNLP